MSPFDRFDRTASKAAAEAAIEQVTENASEAWREEARSATRLVAHNQQFFTTDHIWAAMSPDTQTHERRAMGGILRWALTEGLVMNTHRSQKTDRVAAHRRPLTIWKSLVFQEKH